ncbi:MAG: tetratricopeptide repeat protein [Parvularculaceae bacterium]
MRLFFVTFLALCAGVSAAFADQTDPRLDDLFAELRAGDGLSAEETVGRIMSIWSDAQSDTVDVIFERAVQSAGAGKFQLAEALLDNVTGLAPSFSQGWAMRGVVRLEDDNLTGALDDFTRALALEPRQFEVQIAVAQMQLAGGDKRGAYDRLQKALEWNPHDEHARTLARKLRRELDGQEI